MNVMRENEKGIWVPLEILNNGELSPNEKFVLGGIENIVKDGEECYISNSKFSRTLQVSEKTIAAIVTSLVKKDFIQIKIDYEKETGLISRRGILLTDKFKNIIKISKIALLENEEIDEKVNKIGVLEFEEVTEKVNENGLLENEQPIYNNINNSLSLKDGLLEHGLLNNGSLKEEKIKKESISNVFINTREEVEKKEWIGLGVFQILGKPKYERLEKCTKRNILKYCSHISEEVFDKSFDKITKLEEKGLIKDFGAAFYLDIQGKWKRYEDTSKILNEKPIIEKENLDEKIRWFKNCFRGIRVDEYEEYLERIPFYILEKNRKKLGRMTPFEFKQEFKKLVK